MMRTSFIAALGALSLAACDALPVGGGSPLVTSDADARRVGPAAGLPFGQIATTCELPRGQMGQPVATSAGYTIYDSLPGSTAQRVHYIDGFADGCARQFTAALVLTGDIGTHEVLRYSQSADERAYTQADTAYEAIKLAFCSAPAGTPCGDRIEALGQRTTFVTAYPQFSGSAEWTEILLHEGTVAAAGVER
ncbi:hypothetical protein EU805_13260 [Salipiger sp. IMCC34102]|uniref:hypothetical protein n=1 Tax=Salipiger sp. IMCC34102 TaxID=2510647 RepID=UPI00101BACF6|nr:hypothetical protein [Salipiger sp. IMCC34102]RYH01621.1 hypothetical protein EU805_13260 [Salipiger sp. IMCC34102]